MDDLDHRKILGEGKQGTSQKDESHAAEPSSKDTKESKGKGREPTIFDRMRSSAKGASDAMISGDAGLHGMAASSSAKVNPTGSGVFRDTPNILQQTSLNRQSQGARAPGINTFREARAPDSSSQAFDDFVNGQEQRLPQEPSRAEPGSGWTMGHSEATDGSAVVDILSQPLSLDEMPGEDDQDDGLTPAAAAKLREALFGSPGSSISWDDLLNFTPQFLAGPGDEIESALVHLGTTDPSAAREIWLSQWQDVLSAYTDEVWGDLGTLAAEARKEVDDLVLQDRDRGGELGGGALGRLRMILAHVRGST